MSGETELARDAEVFQREAERLNDEAQEARPEHRPDLLAKAKRAERISGELTAAVLSGKYSES